MTKHFSEDMEDNIDFKKSKKEVKMGLLERIKKNSTIKESDILSKSKFFTKKDMVQTPIPALNIALSGRLDGGLTPGLTLWAGPSKHFKTMFCLILAKSYMDKYPDAPMLFYDSEFGTPQTYFESLGIDMDRVVHTPVTDVEQLKFDIMKQLQDIQRDEKVIIMIDSIGNLASKKEVEDALNEKAVADMSRAKQLKSLFRMVTPHLSMKDIPLIAVSHTYDTMELYSKQILSGGKGQVYSADNIFIIGRQQEKDGTEITGYNFIINVEKSRYVREKAKIPISVTFEGGLDRWTGLLDIAQESGHVVKPSNGWYSRVLNGEQEEKKYRAKDTNTKEFWLDILKDLTFQEWVVHNYQVSSNNLLEGETFIDKDLVEINDEV